MNASSNIIVSRKNIIFFFISVAVTLSLVKAEVEDNNSKENLPALSNNLAPLQDEKENTGVFSQEQLSDNALESQQEPLIAAPSEESEGLTAPVSRYVVISTTDLSPYVEVYYPAFNKLEHIGISKEDFSHAECTIKLYMSSGKHTEEAHVNCGNLPSKILNKIFLKSIKPFAGNPLTKFYTPSSTFWFQVKTNKELERLLSKMEQPILAEQKPLAVVSIEEGMISLKNKERLESIFNLGQEEKIIKKMSKTIHHAQAALRKVEGRLGKNAGISEHCIQGIKEICKEFKAPKIATWAVVGSGLYLSKQLFGPSIDYLISKTKVSEVGKKVADKIKYDILSEPKPTHTSTPLTKETMKGVIEEFYGHIATLSRENTQNLAEIMKSNTPSV